MKATIRIIPYNHAQPGSFPRNPGRCWVSELLRALEREQNISGYCLVDCHSMTCWEYDGGHGGQSLPSLGLPAGKSQTIHSKHRKHG